MVKKEGHTMSLDWYLLGVLLFEMLDGFPPFYSDDKDELMINIITENLKIPSHLSKNVRDLLSKLLERDPRKRLGTINDAEELKVHPWFSCINWVDVTNKKLEPYEPYLAKTKEEIMLNIGRREKMTIEKSKEYLKELDKKTLKKNRLNGWSFHQTVIEDHTAAGSQP